MAVEIQNGVYDITTRRDDNGRRYRVYLFDDDVPTLVDSGHEGTTERIFDEVTELNVTPERLVITHGDGDHVGGLAALVERYDIETYAPANESLSSPVEPDVRYTDSDRIGGFTPVRVPGHTPEHHALVHKERRIAVLGDAVFGSDLRGLPEGFFTLPPGAYSTDLNMADESLGKLLEYEFEIGLVYHGTSVLSDAREKLDRFVNFPGKA